MTTPFHVHVTTQHFQRAIKLKFQEGKRCLLGQDCTVAMRALGQVPTWHEIDPRFSANPHAGPRFQLKKLPDGTVRHYLSYNHNGQRLAHFLTEEQHAQVRPYTIISDKYAQGHITAHAAQVALKKLEPLNLLFFIDPETDDYLRPAEFGTRNRNANTDGDRAASRRYSKANKYIADFRSRLADELSA